MVDFLRIIDVNAGGLRLKKGPGNFTPNVLDTNLAKDNVDEHLNLLHRVSCCPRKQQLEPQFRDNSVPTKILISTPERERGPALSGPVLRDTARLSQRHLPIARYGVFGVSTLANGYLQTDYFENP